MGLKAQALVAAEQKRTAMTNAAGPDVEATVWDCLHCGRRIERTDDGYWVDPEADGDDRVWRETCDSHDTLIADHQPRDQGDPDPVAGFVHELAGWLLDGELDDNGGEHIVENDDAWSKLHESVNGARYLIESGLVDHPRRRPGVTVEFDRDHLEEMAGRILTDDEADRVQDAIGHSSIGETMHLIIGSITD